MRWMLYECAKCCSNLLSYGPSEELSSIIRLWCKREKAQQILQDSRGLYIMIYWCLVASTQPIHVRITSEAQAEFPLAVSQDIGAVLSMYNPAFEGLKALYTNLYMEFKVLVHGEYMFKNVLSDAGYDSHSLGIVEVPLQGMKRWDGKMWVKDSIL